MAAKNQEFTFSVEQFTTDQLALFQESFVFYAAQVNKSADHLTHKEVPFVLRSCGILVDSTDEEKIRQEGSNNVNFPNFLTIAARCMTPKTTDESLIECFRRFDPSNKGSIPTAEFKHALTTLGDPFSAEEVDQFVKDADSGGSINYKDYAKRLLVEASDIKKL